MIKSKKIKKNGQKKLTPIPIKTLLIFIRKKSRKKKKELYFKINSALNI